MGIENRDYTIIIDKSGSMNTNDCNGRSRWLAAEESTVGLAHKVATLDPDGLTVYFFNGGFKRHDNVGPEKVSQVFKEHEPNGSTNLAAVLHDVFANWRSRKGDGKLKGGDTVLVITDGTPDDKAAAAKEIVAVSKLMDSDAELAVSFLQIGRDTGAQQFLKGLDDDLTSQGAKFDLVDAKTFEELESGSLTDALIAAIED